MKWFDSHWNRFFYNEMADLVAIPVILYKVVEGLWVVSLKNHLYWSDIIF